MSDWHQYAQYRPHAIPAYAMDRIYVGHPSKSLAWFMIRGSKHHLEPRTPVAGAVQMVAGCADGVVKGHLPHKLSAHACDCPCHWDE